MNPFILSIKRFRNFVKNLTKIPENIFVRGLQGQKPSHILKLAGKKARKP